MAKTTNKPKPTVDLSDCDDNAFAIMARCRKAARRAGWTDQEFAKVSEEATSGDYDHLLQTFMKHFDVT